MKVNFTNISVETAFDMFQEMNIAPILGNFIHQNTADIGLDDTARAIYHSKGVVEIPDEHAAEIIALVSDKQCLLVAGVKRAVINELTAKDHEQ